MSSFQYSTPQEAYQDTVRRVMRDGEQSDDTLEIIADRFEIHAPWKVPFTVRERKANMAIARADILSLLGMQPLDLYQRIKTPKLAKFQDGPIQWGSYGERIRHQIHNLGHELARDEFTRQAVLSIYDGQRDLAYHGRDTPCTLSIQFLPRDGYLNTIVTMRSNDAYVGLFYDLHQFCALHCTIAETQGLTPGTYTHQAGSMHLYDRDVNAAVGMVEANRMPDSMSRSERSTRIHHVRQYERLDQLWPERYSMHEVIRFCQSVSSGIVDPCGPDDTEFMTWLIK